MHTHVIISPKYGRAFVHLDDCDADLLEGVTWGARFVRGGIPHCIARQIGRSAALLHHEIMKRIHPSIKFDRYVVCDHISGNPFDCTRQNLRICSNKQNAQNRQQKRKSPTPYPGVYLIKETGRWRALIVPNGKRIHLGVYDTMEEAIVARKSAEREHYGDLLSLIVSSLQPTRHMASDSTPDEVATHTYQGHYEKQSHSRRNDH